MRYGTPGNTVLAGSDPADLPNTVNSMTPSGDLRGQFVTVNRTNRAELGAISLKIVSRGMSLPVSFNTVVNASPSVETATEYW